MVFGGDVTRACRTRAIVRFSGYATNRRRYLFRDTHRPAALRTGLPQRSLCVLRQNERNTAYGMQYKRSYLEATNQLRVLGYNAIPVPSRYLPGLVPTRPDAVQTKLPSSYQLVTFRGCVIPYMLGACQARVTYDTTVQYHSTL